MESSQKLTLTLFAMWLAVFAMAAVLVIDQGIKKEILQRANAVREDLEKLEALSGIQTHAGNAGRANPPARASADKRSHNGSSAVDHASAIVEESPIGRQGGTGAKPSPRKGARPIGPPASTSD